MVCINNRFIEKIILLLLIILIFSNGIEPLIGGINMSVPLTSLVGVIIIIYTSIKKNIPKINISDLIIFLFIIYIISQGLIISNVNSVFRIIFASISFYYFGRFVKLDEENYLFVKNVINILSWMIIAQLILKYDRFTSYRISIDGTSPIAVGEMMGIFSIINLFNLNGINKNFISTFNYIVGALINLFILSSRSSFFFILIATLVILLYFSKRKFRSLSLVAISLIIYIVLFNSNSILIKEFPALNRFTVSGIANDPSVIGSSNNLGRKDLWMMSLDVIKKKTFFGGGAGIVYSHNIFLEAFSSFGFIGITLIVVFIIGIILTIIRTKRKNIVLIALLLYVFLYRQFSFAFDAHKSLFLFSGMMITYCKNIYPKNTSI